MRVFKRAGRERRNRFAFFAILLLLFGLISMKTDSFMLSNDSIVPSRDKTIYRVRREPADSLDVIIVGDSLTYSSISPLQLWKEHGFTSYVCGQWGQKIIETEDMLKTALRRQKPRVIDSSVQYNMLSASYKELGLDGHESGMDVLACLVTDVVLTPLLRDQYGVYSPYCTVYLSGDGGMYIYTYRDPNIAETFWVLDGLPDMIDGSGIDQETLDGYILESYTYFAMPQGELTGAVNAAEAVLKGRPQDEAVTCMRQLKQLDIEKLADYKELLEKFTEAGAVRTAGGAAAINSEADRYDKILSPF